MKINIKKMQRFIKAQAVCFCYWIIGRGICLLTGVSINNTDSARMAVKS